MAGATSAAERAPVTAREVVIIGGGCYGSYYLRQLGRAAQAGAFVAERVTVVDHDAHCRAAIAPPPEAAALPWSLAVAPWTDWLAEQLPRATADDRLVPSPLMPHLLYEWLLARAQARSPARTVQPVAIGEPPADVPWQRTAPDGRHYVSYATWMCPINCIEPARCPHTRGARDWSLPSTIAAWAEARAAAGTPFAATAVLACTHRTFGVGMIDVAAVHEADARLGAIGPAGGDALVATVSHCHGALAALRIS